MVLFIIESTGSKQKYSKHLNTQQWCCQFTSCYVTNTILCLDESNYHIRKTKVFAFKKLILNLHILHTPINFMNERRHKYTFISHSGCSKHALVFAQFCRVIFKT